jgi:hypothetical protein
MVRCRRGMSRKREAGFLPRPCPIPRPRLEWTLAGVDVEHGSDHKDRDLDSLVVARARTKSKRR